MIADQAGSDKPEKPDVTITVTPAPGRPGRVIAVARNGVGELHRDTIDLNSATARRRFLGASMRAAYPGTPPDDWPAEVLEDLQRQLAAFAAAPPGAPGPTTAPPADGAAEDPRVAEL